MTTLVQEREQEVTFTRTRIGLLVSLGRTAEALQAQVLHAEAVVRWQALPLLTLCAWCRKVIHDGRLAHDGHPSHGICPACFDREQELW